MKTPFPDGYSEPQPVWPQVFLQPADPPPIIAPMTVGIAAICDNGNAIVMAADRLVSLGEAFQYIEGDRQKMVELTPRVWLSITGTIQDSEFARERFTRASNLFAGQSVLQIARRLRKACEHLRARQIEEQLIKAGVGVSYAEFSRACLNNPTTTIITDVYTKIGNFSFELELLLCGMDDSDAHIYRINCFRVNSHEGIGFTTIGIGRTAAAVALAAPGYGTIPRPIEETIYRVYEAKRASEQTRLVGAFTDMVLLRQGGEASPLAPELIDAMAGIYERRRPQPLSSTDAKIIADALPSVTPLHSQAVPEATTHDPPIQPPSPGSGS